MRKCQACGADVQASAFTCPHCLASLPAAGASAVPIQSATDASADETRMAPVGPGSMPRTSSHSGSHPGGKAVTSSSGWLSSSGAIDHGRFPPGTLLGGRYRIVGRLGKGGMGEVFRADDLKLGQPVALKFLPPDVDRDPARLTQLHTEVRMARQVSHPNVCRVYDIDEVEGHTFLSMEYVDGEDLSSLLRRVGRFNEERGLELARQMCAGLGAAHERNVVHRDFKPANVMLDSDGRVRITDFGLAGITGETLRAGTPAYMAPEQIAGSEVTSRSDIYALGLVLYEVFTGQRALEGKNLAELIRRREQVGGIAPPSTLVKEIDPLIERAIMRCLEPDPAKRPASALAVAAALPGGDPLAAALAAGQTPSPEMVAAAGGVEVISRRTAFLAAGWIAISLLTIMVCYERVMLVNRVSSPKTPEALQDRAVEALAKLGYPIEPRTMWTARGMGFSLDYAAFIDRTSTEPDRWRRLAAQRPEALYLWHRTSPRPLVPLGDDRAVSGQNPPLNVSGMTLTIVDASGRLAEFLAVPKPYEEGAVAPPMNWQVLFEAAGIDMASFTPVAPRVVPPVFAEERKAWEGPLPELPDHVFRVEAAAYAGKPVYFLVGGQWSRSSRAPEPAAPLFNVLINEFSALVMPGLMVVGALLARRNVKLGRGDRKGAFRAASFVFVMSLASWLLLEHVTPLGPDVVRFFDAIGNALFASGLLWLTYLGLEPYVRRYFPDSLIGWSRLIAGRWRDPRVGRDVMLGVAAGLGMTVFYAVHNIVPMLLGRPEPMPLGMEASSLLGVRHVLAFLTDRLAEAVQSSMLAVVGIVGLLILLKRQWLATVAGIVIFTPVALSGMFRPGTPILDMIIGTAIITIFVLTIVRVGLLATMAALATHFILLRAPLTLDLASWRAPLGLWLVGVIAVAGFGAVYVAKGTKDDGVGFRF